MTDATGGNDKEKTNDGRPTSRGFCEKVEMAEKCSGECRDQEQVFPSNPAVTYCAALGSLFVNANFTVMESRYGESNGVK